MKRLTTTLALTLALTTTGLAGEDGLRREGKDRTRKDALEGKAPPALQVTDWMNTDGKALSLEALRWKVVILDFWGKW